eukprot:tig00000197_g15689.t1
MLAWLSAPCILGRSSSALRFLSESSCRPLWQSFGVAQTRESAFRRSLFTTRSEMGGEGEEGVKKRRFHDGEGSGGKRGRGRGGRGRGGGGGGKGKERAPKSEAAEALFGMQPVRPKLGETEMGFVNLDKPKGMTSHDCVSLVRRMLGTKAVGHGGTLDPAATGVLPLAVGRATKMLRFLPSEKAYRATIRFGVVTDTDDLDGKVVKEKPCPHVTRAAVEEVVPRFVGHLKQIPPAYSAISVNGQRLYKLARAGKELPELPPRDVLVYHLRIDAFREGEYPEVDVTVTCGPGTYIRSIARDMGRLLGTGGTLASLQRVLSHGFHLSEAVQGEALNSTDFALHLPEAPFRFFRAVHLNEAQVRLWRKGMKLDIKFSNVTGKEEPAWFGTDLAFPDPATLPSPEPLPALEPEDAPADGAGEEAEREAANSDEEEAIAAAELGEPKPEPEDAPAGAAGEAGKGEGQAAAAKEEEGEVVRVMMKAPAGQGPGEKLAGLGRMLPHKSDPEMRTIAHEFLMLNI